VLDFYSYILNKTTALIFSYQNRYVGFVVRIITLPANSYIYLKTPQGQLWRTILDTSSA